MSSEPTIIIVGSFRFPNGDAAAARVLGLAKAIRQSGFRVMFCGWEKEPRFEDLTGSGVYEYQNFRYYSQAEFRSEKISPWRRLFGYLFAGRRTIQWLKDQDHSGTRAIIAYHGRTLFLLRLRHFCLRRGIELLFDCTEWYDSRSLVGGRFGLPSLDESVRMRIINPLMAKGIVISRYLENYYARRGCDVVRIPPLVDVDEPKWSAGEIRWGGAGKLSLVYAGTPGKKDLLPNILKGLAMVRKEGKDVVLNLLGPSRQDLRSLVPAWSSVLEDLGEGLVFHGRVEQSQVPKLVAAADFSVLLRVPERFAQAGFPTKVVESLTVGVPVICNHTSDLADYVIDGQTGILLADCSEEAFAAGLRRAFFLSTKQIDAMRAAAIRQAKMSFDYKNYVEVMRQHLGSAGAGGVSDGVRV